MQAAPEPGLSVGPQLRSSLPTQAASQPAIFISAFMIIHPRDFPQYWHKAPFRLKSLAMTGLIYDTRRFRCCSEVNLNRRFQPSNGHLRRLVPRGLRKVVDYLTMMSHRDVAGTNWTQELSNLVAETVNSHMAYLIQMERQVESLPPVRLRSRNLRVGPVEDNQIFIASATPVIKTQSHTCIGFVVPIEINHLYQKQPEAVSIRTGATSHTNIVSHKSP